MKPIIIINTFKTIGFDNSKKPIVICDIDHTFIRSEFDYSYYMNRIKNSINNKVHLNRAIMCMIEKSMKLGHVKQTDKEGFLSMLQKVKLLGGKLVFLTARSQLSHKKTIGDLKRAGLEHPEHFEIHYTGNEITKGEYIQKHNLLKDYDHSIFIDDFSHFLKSALKLYPDMNCYLFKYKI
jgi:predicted secreted acid phosphatase